MNTRDARVQHARDGGAPSTPREQRREPGGGPLTARAQGAADDFVVEFNDALIEAAENIRRAFEGFSGASLLGRGATEPVIRPMTLARCYVAERSDRLRRVLLRASAKRYGELQAQRANSRLLDRDPATLDI